MMKRYVANLTKEQLDKIKSNTKSFVVCPFKVACLKAWVELLEKSGVDTVDVTVVHHSLHDGGAIIAEDTNDDIPGHFVVAGRGDREFMR